MGDYIEAAAEDQKSMSQVVNVVLGSLRSYDGNCDENVTLKLNFALS